MNFGENCFVGKIVCFVGKEAIKNDISGTSLSDGCFK